MDFTPFFHWSYPQVGGHSCMLFSTFSVVLLKYIGQTLFIAIVHHYLLDGVEFILVVYFCMSMNMDYIEILVVCVASGGMNSASVHISTFIPISYRLHGKMFWLISNGDDVQLKILGLAKIFCGMTALLHFMHNDMRISLTDNDIILTVFMIRYIF